LLKIFLCYTFFAVRKGFFTQGAAVLYKTPFDALKYGFLFYASCAALIVLFAISLVGLPLSLLICLVMAFTSASGEVCLAITIGRFVNKNLTIALIIGVLAFEGLMFFNIGYFLALTLYPLIFSGIYIAAFVNVYVKNIYFEAE
jgi:hypothetical protein